MGNVRNVEREKKQDNGDQGAKQTSRKREACFSSGSQLRGIIDVVNVILPILKLTVLGRALFFRAQEAMFPPEQDQWHPGGDGIAGGK